MKLTAINFSKTKNYKIAILVKDSAFRFREIEQHYVRPLVSRGFAFEEIVALNLVYNSQGKAPVTLIKEHLKSIETYLNNNNIKHVVCCDATYFKVLCKVKKAEPHYGYVLPTIWPGVQASLSLNYMQLFYNPQLQNKLFLGLDGITACFQGKSSIFKEIIKVAHYPEKLSDIETTLKDLSEYPALTVDIETFGLELSKSALASIAFGINEHIGVAFLVKFHRVYDEEYKIEKLLKNFFDNYKGKLIFHGSTFDIGRLILNLYMESYNDIHGLLEGLNILCRNMEDTLILTYLATNNAQENKLDLKSNTQEFTGNYALEEIKDVKNITDKKKLLKYNLIDVLATWYLYNKYREQVRQEQEKVYQEIFLPAVKVLTQTELIGIPFNKQRVNETRTYLNQEQTLLINTILSHPIIKQFNQKLKLEAVLTANSKLKVKRKSMDDFSDLEFNPNSDKQLRKLLYEELNLPVQHYTDTKLPSTDGKALSGLISHLKQKYDL
jgi:DNA polymerase-1